MSVDPQTISTLITLGQGIGDIFGSLFKDKDYPYGAVHLRIVNGQVVNQGITVLDGTSRVEFQTLYNQLKRDIDRCLKAKGFFNKQGFTIKAVCIGHNIQRPRSKIPSGFFASDIGCGFATGVTYGGLPDIVAAISRLYQLIDDLSNPLTGGQPLMQNCGGGTTTPTQVNNDLNNAISDNLDTINNSLSVFQNTFNAFTDTLLESNESLADDITGGILGAIDLVLDDTDSILEDALRKLLELIERSLRGIEITHERSEEKILETVSNGIIGQEFILADFTRRLADIIDDNLDAQEENLKKQEEVFAAIINLILDKIDEEEDIRENTFLEEITTILESIVDRLPFPFGLAKDAIDASEDLREIITDAMRKAASDGEASWEEVGKNVIKDIILPDDLADEPLEDALPTVIRRISESLNLDEDRCRYLFQDFLDDNSVAGAVGSFLVSFFTLAYLPMLVVMAKAQKCLYPWNIENPTRILDPVDAITAHYRNVLDRDNAALMIQQHGFTRADADTLLDISRQLPDDTVTFSLWLRGLITENDVDAIFEGRGFDPAIVKVYKELRFFIPPVADLVTMAVREVFSPEQVKELSLFEELPEEFVFWAKRQGVSEEWSERYWGAHWALPSVQMGYEMLHRGVITEDQLKGLLKAQDVAPVWRDRLIAISYAPFTRVDIRRMHRVGVLDRDEVKRAYMDIGYNDERAEKLTEFTEELNQDNNILDITDFSELSRSNVLEFYRLGIIEQETAFGMLLSIGFDVNTARLWIIDVDLKEEIKEREAEASLIVAQAKARVISYNEANDQLVELGLSSRELLKYQKQLTTQQAENTKLPSKADLDKMLKSDIISEEGYRETMGLIGYSDVWIDRYIDLMGVSEDDAT